MCRNIYISTHIHENYKFITMKKVIYYLFGLFSIVLFNSCTEQSLEKNQEVSTKSRPITAMPSNP